MIEQINTIKRILAAIDTVLEEQEQFYDFFLMKSKKEELDRFKTNLIQYRAILELKHSRLSKKVKK